MTDTVHIFQHLCDSVHRCVRWCPFEYFIVWEHCHAECSNNEVVVVVRMPLKMITIWEKISVRASGHEKIWKEKHLKIVFFLIFFWTFTQSASACFLCDTDIWRLNPRVWPQFQSTTMANETYKHVPVLCLWKQTIKQFNRNCGQQTLLNFQRITSAIIKYFIEIGGNVSAKILSQTIFVSSRSVSVDERSNLC